MAKERRLSDLIEPGFADGYDAFKEIVEYTQATQFLPPNEKAFLRFYELI